MWLYFLLFSSVAASRLSRLICMTGETPSDVPLKYQRCGRYPEGKKFPYCVYLVVPSNSTHQGKMVYGCAYSKDLPNECVQLGEHYTPHTEVVIRRKTYAGALMCCSDDYCNEVDEPVFSLVRVIDDSQTAIREIFPILICVFVALTGFLPLMNNSLQNRLKKSLRQAEQADMLQKITMDVVIKEIPNFTSLTPNFANIKKLHEVLKAFDTAYKFAVNESIEESECSINQEIMVVQANPDQCRAVKREWPTKLSSLAHRMVEHGPYQFDFDPTELGDLFDSVAQLLSQEPTLVEMSGDVHIYGNLQGSYSDLYRWFHKNGWPPKRKVLFLGGLTEDGHKWSLETIALVFALKKQMPNHVFILRGATEVYPIEIEGRFSRRVTRCLADVIQRVCGYLPLAALINETILCCHGGIPSHLTSLNEIRDIRRPIHNVKKGTIEAMLIFSQIGKGNHPIAGARGCRFNPTSEEYLSTLLKLKLDMVIRSRNPVEDGFQLCGMRLLSIWSAPGMSKCKAGTSVVVSHDKIVTLHKMAEHGTFTPAQLDAYRRQIIQSTGLQSVKKTAK